MVDDKKLTVLDLFCGAGGLSKGFEMAGFEIAAGIDFDKHSIETFSKVYPRSIAICDDIKDITPKDLMKRICNKKIDVIIGGPPCQGFSTANRQRKFIDDSRNVLYKHFVKFVDEIKPNIIVIENVSGIVKMADEIKEDFERIRYFVDFRILNAKNFGIPQNRRRVFFIGVNKDSIFFKMPGFIQNIFGSIEKEKTDKIVPLSDALWGLRKIEPRKEKNNSSIESEKHGLTEDEVFATTSPPNYILKINQGKTPTKIFNHKARYNNERDIEIFRRLPQGGKSDHPSIQDIMPYKRRKHIFKDKFFRLIAKGPCKTITSHMRFDCNMYIHPFENRGLSPREAARIQSFPDDYVFCGPPSSWYHQAGNSVPPMLALTIGKNIFKIMKIYGGKT
jgi:DNA (cytosine-5)-methyltransferase 1